MLALLREISVRHWGRAPLRSLLIVLGIGLGVALYVAIEATSASMLTAFGEIVARVSGRADLTIQSGGSGVPGEIVADVAEIPGVAHAASTLEITTQAPDYGESLLILGVDFLGDMHFLPFNVKEGEKRAIEDPLAFVNDPTALLVSAKFAARHHLTKGSAVRLLTAEGVKDFHLRGILEDTGPAASFGGQVAVMFLDAAQVSFARGTFVDRIDVAVTPGADVATVRSAIAKHVGEGLTVERPEQLGSRLAKLTTPLRAALWLSGFTSLLVGAFLVYNAVGIAVVQRRREIGVLRALGITRLRTVLLFCLESAMLALPGIALGLVLARSLARYSASQALDSVNALYASISTIEPRITLPLALRGAAAGILTAVGAAIWPARRGAWMDPAIVLRGSSSVERHAVPYWWMLAAGALGLTTSFLPIFRGSVGLGALALTVLVFGAALSTPALVVLVRRAVVGTVERILGLPARLGLDYVERTLGRSTVNVLALMVAVSISVSVGGWLASFEKSLVVWMDQMSVADLTVTAGSPLLDRHHIALSPDAADRIEKLPGVSRVQRFRMVDQTLSGKTIRLVATDSDAFIQEAALHGKSWPVVSGDPLEPGALSSGHFGMLGESAATRLGLHAGDHLVFHAPKADLDVQIRAIIIDYTSEQGAAFLDRKLFLEYWGDEALDAISVYAKPGENVDRLADGVREALGGHQSIFVTKTTTTREQLLTSLAKTFSYSRSVEIVTLFIALMGVIGTMVAAVLDRTREIGMLRAIGATSRQVGLAIVTEAGFLGFCAVIAGIGLGVLECLLFLKTLLLVDTGWHLDFVFPWAATARIGGLVVATSTLAGGLPALRAAKSDVTSAVVYE